MDERHRAAGVEGGEQLLLAVLAEVTPALFASSTTLSARNSSSAPDRLGGGRFDMGMGTVAKNPNQFSSAGDQRRAVVVEVAGERRRVGHPRQNVVPGVDTDRIAVVTSGWP